MQDSPRAVKLAGMTVGERHVDGFGMNVVVILPEIVDTEIGAYDALERWTTHCPARENSTIANSNLRRWPWWLTRADRWQMSPRALACAQVSYTPGRKSTLLTGQLLFQAMAG